MKSVRTLVIGMVAVLAISASAEASTIHGIGSTLPTEHCLIHSISGNGTVVVGSRFDINDPTYISMAFSWTEGGGMVDLGYLTAAPGIHSWQTGSSAFGVSHDGSVIAGKTSSPTSFLFGHDACQWMGGGIAVLDPDIIIGSCRIGSAKYASSGAFDTSADGSVIVGRAGTPASNGEAFLWTEAGGVVGLPFSPDFHSSANAVSDDGNFIVGEDGAYQAFLYDRANGTVTPLDSLPSTDDASCAYGISADGTVVVGSSGNNGGNPFLGRAVRWTETGVESLGLIEGDLHSSAFAVSADGSVIVGTRSFPRIGPGDLIRRAFIWDEAYPDGKMRDLTSVLESHGLNMDGWMLEDAYGISDDGLTIVGSGSGPDGSSSWIVRLDPPAPPPIPEPLTILCVFGGIVGLGGYVRKRRMA